MKSYGITDLEHLNSRHINEVVCDLLLKAARERQDEAKNNWYGIYKSHLRSPTSSFHGNIIDLVELGKDRLRRDPLVFPRRA